MAMIDYDAYKKVQEQNSELIFALELLCKAAELNAGKLHYVDVKEAREVIEKIKAENENAK